MRLFFIFFFTLFYVSSFAQSISDLSKEKEDLLNKISQNSELIKQFSVKKDDELKLLTVLDQKITKRKRLVDIYKKEIEISNLRINKLNFQLDSLDKVILTIKDDYSKIIYQMHLNKLGRNDLTYILSSSSFNESYRRFIFLSQYNDYRKKQAAILVKNVADYDSIKSKIEERKIGVKQLLNSITNESSNIQSEMLIRQAKVSELSSKESQLVKENQAAQKSAKMLEDKIVALIAEEAEKKSNKSLFSSNISKSKGKLPWPSSSHLVINEFGEHEHPVLKNLKVRNNGIDIDMQDNPSVLSVFSGVVSRIIAIPGYNATVIVRHGSVLTVYTNLSDVYVKKDDKVKQGTKLGSIYRGDGVNKNILHFELWNEDLKQNPLTWLDKH